MSTRARVLLVGLAVIFALVLAGSAARPLTVRSDVTPQTYCRWVWDRSLLKWCYFCCDLYGCRYVYCE